MIRINTNITLSPPLSILGRGYGGRGIGSRSQISTHSYIGISRSGGQAVITAVVFFLVIAITMSIGVINPVFRAVKQADEFARSRGSFFLAQAANEDAVYRLKMGKIFLSPSTLTINDYSATVSTTAVVGGIQINSSANALGLVRNLQTHLTSGSGASFNYGVQIGEGGLRMKNSSSVKGNVFSNGPIQADDKNIIKGVVISSGPAGL